MPTLAAAEERWRLTIDNAPVGIALVSLEGRFVRVNEALGAMLGYSTDELVRLTFQEITHPDDLAGDLELLDQLTRGEIADYKLRKRYFHSDGHEIWIDLSVGLVRNGRGKPLHYVAHIIDRSDEIAAQERIARMNADLQDQTRALERSNGDLETFAMMASHDLQAPLSTIQGYVELLAAEYSAGLDEQGRQWLERVQTASERMSDLVSSLLTYSRSGHPTERTDVSVPALVDDVRQDLAPLLAEARAVVEVDADAPSVRGDGPRLRQVVQNLVQNAVKYRHPDRAPHVRVAVEARESDWLVTVDDNGRGVPAEQRELVFTLFQRGRGGPDPTGGSGGAGGAGGSGAVRGPDGHGIGLASCRRIVERHGGRIWVEDAPGGAGSRFCFTLPRDAAPGEAGAGETGDTGGSAA